MGTITGMDMTPMGNTSTAPAADGSRRRMAPTSTAAPGRRMPGTDGRRWHRHDHRPEAAGCRRPGGWPPE